MTTQQQIDDFHEACDILEAFTLKVTRPDFKKPDCYRFSVAGACSLLENELWPVGNDRVARMARQLFESLMSQWCVKHGSGRHAYPVPAAGCQLPEHYEQTEWARAHYAFFSWPLWPGDLPATSEQVQYVLKRQQMLCYIRRGVSRMAWRLPSNFLQLREGLKASLVATLQNPDPAKGICSHVLDNNEDSVRLSAMLEQLFRSWPKYSGNYLFPVPAPDKDEGEGSESFAFESATLEATLWKGEYGALRKELCQWCIDNVDRLEMVVLDSDSAQVKALLAQFYP